jgi:hypothetical protein
VPLIPFSTTGSEGIVTIPVHPHASAGPVSLDQGIFEFVPLVSAEELAALPGVVGVDMLHHLGDVIGPRMHSSSALAVVYVEAADEDTLDAALAGIRAAFRLTVE